MGSAFLVFIPAQEGHSNPTLPTSCCPDAPFSSAQGVRLHPKCLCTAAKAGEELEGKTLKAVWHMILPFWMKSVVGMWSFAKCVFLKFQKHVSSESAPFQVIKYPILIIVQN